MTTPHVPPRQLYLDWVQDRIERYKASLSRDQLLALADQAVERLFSHHDGQYPLTEVLLRETVDELIFDRLGLPSFRAWLRRPGAEPPTPPTAPDPAPTETAAPTGAHPAAHEPPATTTDPPTDPRSTRPPTSPLPAPPCQNDTDGDLRRVQPGPAGRRG